MLKFICNPKYNDKKDEGYKGENLRIDILVHYNRAYAGKTYTKNTYKKDDIEKSVLYIKLFSKQSPYEFIILQHIVLL